MLYYIVLYYYILLEINHPHLTTETGHHAGLEDDSLINVRTQVQVPRTHASV